MLIIPHGALDQLSALLLEKAGLKIAADGYHGLRLALRERMPALGISDADEYVRRLREGQGEQELRALLPLVTVTHTEFFRDPRQFRALERRLLPDLLSRARRHGQKVSIWSAGCATGEEPYSLAMLLIELGALKSEVELLATDLNQSAIENAKLGRYTARRMSQVPAERARRFFRPAEDGQELSPEVREWVQFEGLNLASPAFSRVQDSSFDIILCRNVIIYFDLATIRGLMDRFVAALRPGGFLILGYSESLFRVYDRFEMVEVEGAFLYRRPLQELPPGQGPRPERITRDLPVVVPARTPPPPVRSSPPATPAERLPTPAVPSAPGAERQTDAPVTAHRPPAERVSEAARLMHQGQFDAALRALTGGFGDALDDINVQLTLGNLYSLLGRAQDAERVFQEVIAREPLCVDVRMYGAMAAMQVNDYPRARSELLKALFLEPTLALAHYLSAQVSERLGDREGARRAYRNAITHLRFPQRPLAGFYPDLPESPELVSRAARYALAALEEDPGSGQR
ncbi:MAG TPA: CheR family methyltransferase [Myxococcaceae bacterium]|nr:CheR family methyltransferase [Myxococcaceae bacterium]